MKLYIQSGAVLIGQFLNRSSARGFTILESIVIVAILGILLAIMAPGWASFMTVSRLNAAQAEVYQVMRDAQSTARRNHLTWQASFREWNEVVQWAIHPASLSPTNAVWKNLDPNIRLDAETTLQTSNGVRRVQFDENGNVNGQLGRLTLSGKAGGRTKRCVIVSTLIGVVRQGRDKPQMQDGKYCY
ncbi:prepilin-type N-terminal cleavage/methylation domain-containing protein [Kovacikia minuta CCNUW1]|uniref:pilus assembly FimT family protein n=1 Tax=Kovacikia minuta TaxID=2931930 RepID=UPI001CCBD3DA|nr:prepilin-type N-terminal cleavage/methylation domain-containing protein [Kovacikia minuta]UBF25313.1 prepilin-type N-terminal cleavage/methylation domain-containing protein [Kovacikia minuta CCNUW1]